MLQEKNRYPSLFFPRPFQARSPFPKRAGRAAQRTAREGPFLFKLFLFCGVVQVMARRPISGVLKPAVPHRPRQIKNKSVTARAIRDQRVRPWASAAPASFFPSGLSLLSASRERANINFKKGGHHDHPHHRQQSP